FGTVLRQTTRISFAWLAWSLPAAVMAACVWTFADLSVSPFERVSMPARLSHYVFAFLPAAAFGLVLAVPQSVLLVRAGYRSRWWLWPLASAIGWGGTVGRLWFVFFGYPLFSILPPQYDFVVTITIVLWIGILPGLLTGVALAHIVGAAPAPSEAPAPVDIEA
ncbi:MAG: hypothetical protein WCI61_09970, partial [Chloroflexota bacterium]